MIAKPAAFFLRDLRNAASYRLSFISSIAALFFSIATLHLTAGLVEQGKPQALASFNNDYFTFALIGASLALFTQAVTNIFPSAIRGAQVTGTLEVLLGTRTTVAAFLVYSSLYLVTSSLIQLIGGLLVGEFVLGANLRADQALLATLILLLTTAAFAGIGILSAAFVLRFKQRDPISSFAVSGSFLVSGIIYPTSVLPGWLHPISAVMPLTYAASALRSVLLEGIATRDVAGNIAVLSAFALLLPFSIFVFSYAVHRSRVVGSLSQY